LLFAVPLVLPALVNLVLPYRLTPDWTFPNWPLLPIVLYASLALVISTTTVAAVTSATVTALGFERGASSLESRHRVLDGFALIKLNGGLATSMGLEQPKTLVSAKDGRSFLDIIIGQTLALRRRHGVRLPLVLMDSEATRNPTLEAMGKHPELEIEGLPPDFLQSMIPKLNAHELIPVDWPRAPALEWCPPGHGDVFGSLRSSGMLAALLERGFRYAMISNADNLGAAFDSRIAHHVAHESIPFLMEVVEGTEADRKGGHIARRRRDQRLILRETAQTPPEDEESFRDFRHWRFYNTNSLWVDLLALDSTLDQHQGMLRLPLIVNRKTVDPTDTGSTKVLQLETAMGAAVSTIDGAGALEVPRTRFAPVKTTDDLLVARSDLWELRDDGAMVPHFDGRPPLVSLDKAHFGMLRDFEARFPAGAPSLVDAQRLEVRALPRAVVDEHVDPLACNYLCHLGGREARIEEHEVRPQLLCRCCYFEKHNTVV